MSASGHHGQAGNHRDGVGSSWAGSSQYSGRSLPSSRYQHTNWNDLLDTSVITGNQLRAPRVRQAPLPGDPSFGLRPSDALPLPHVTDSSKPKQVIKQLDRQYGRTENWENALVVNLSYQNLGEPYQLKNCSRILQRLIQCKQLVLIDNSLINLSHITLPRCKSLCLSKNGFTSFKHLPTAPLLEELTLSENGIRTLDGLPRLSTWPLRSLKLAGNPVVFSNKYRQKVFAVLPSLEVLDGIKRRQNDVALDEQEPQEKSTSSLPEAQERNPCSIS